MKLPRRTSIYPFGKIYVYMYRFCVWRCVGICGYDVCMFMEMYFCGYDICGGALFGLLASQWDSYPETGYDVCQSGVNSLYMFMYMYKYLYVYGYVFVMSWVGTLFGLLASQWDNYPETGCGVCQSGVNCLFMYMYKYMYVFGYVFVVWWVGTLFGLLTSHWDNCPETGCDVIQSGVTFDRDVFFVDMRLSQDAFRTLSLAMRQLSWDWLWCVPVRR